MQKIKIKLDPGAIMPTRAHKDDAGLDLYAMEKVMMRPKAWTSIKTGVHIEIPAGYAGLMTSKSGLMKNRGLTCRGTIDAGYTGAVEAIVFNHSAEWVSIEAGDKITQLVLVPIITPELEVVEELEETERGNGGFGSTGR